MQLQEIKKIKELIKVSNLLSSSEKEEWLLLVDIMNDKQLGELKNILDYIITTPSGLASMPSSPKANTPFIANTSIQEGDLHIPPLTHIMNLPTMSTPVFSKDKEALKVQQGSPNKKQAENKLQVILDSKKTGFWQKIKNILKEKELPPGHPEPVSELELPERVVLPYSIVPFINRARILPAIPKPKSVPFPPSKLVTDSINNKQNLVLDKKDTKPKLSESPKPFKAPVLEKPLVLSEAKKTDQSVKTIPLAAKIQNNVSENKSFIPGLENVDVFAEAKLASKKDISQTVSSQPEVLSLLISEDFNNLDEVSSLNIVALEKNLIPALKKMVLSAGYHKLIYALEKSPLFQAYINTGLSALGGKLGISTSSKEDLSREQFEQFVDVLRAIKN